MSTLLKKKKIVILGSTGSIGLSTLDIVKNNPELFEIKGISFHTNTDESYRQIKEFNPQFAAVTGLKKAEIPSNFNSLTDVKFFFGQSGLKNMIEESEADIIVNGIAGASGFLPSFWTVDAGIDLALANKETIVMAGPLILKKAEHMKTNVIPVDSEHSAIFHLLKNKNDKEINELILTASGGAFRNTPLEKLNSVTPEDALKHPTWNMGNKITIDSATMANKGLEIIEAKYLFNISRIKVLIHPQSYVHSLIRTNDNNLYAQISNPDMRIPIKNALTYPDIMENNVEPLNLSGVNLNFTDWDKNRYPMLSLAYDSLEHGGAWPIVYNASNEVAVNAFMNKKISFTEIHKYVHKILETDWKIEVNSIDGILLADAEARKKTDQAILNKSIK
jgi:1-deoxy-D-xylulose-5-phosphate reductoisomerase